MPAFVPFLRNPTQAINFKVSTFSPNVTKYKFVEKFTSQSADDKELIIYGRALTAGLRIKLELV